VDGLFQAIMQLYPLPADVEVVKATELPPPRYRAAAALTTMVRLPDIGWYWNLPRRTGIKFQWQSFVGRPVVTFFPRPARRALTERGTMSMAPMGEI
jgi:hypothetical protein